MKLFRVLDYWRKYIRVDQLLRYISIITAQDVRPSMFFIAFFKAPRSFFDLLTMESF